MVKNIFIIFVFIISIISINILAQSKTIKNPKKTEHSLINSLVAEVEFNYKGELFSDISGGNEKKSTFINYFDLVFNLSSENLGGWNGTELKASIFGLRGNDINEYAETSQGISNIAAPNTLKLYELWLEQNLFNNRFSLLFGLLDLNSEFDSIISSGIFINPSQGIGSDFSQTGVSGPSIYPSTSFAVRFKYKFSPFIKVKTSAFNAVPEHFFNKHDGLLIVTEIDYSNTDDENYKNYFSFELGSWYYTGKFTDLNSADIMGKPDYVTGNYGIYFSAEKSFFKTSQNEIKGLEAFIRYGITDKSVNKIFSYLGAGIVYTGLLHGRKNDKIGLAISRVDNNPKYLSQMHKENKYIRSYEQIIELTYLCCLSEYLAIQPNIQLVLNPAFCKHNNYALLSGLRLELSM